MSTIRWPDRQTVLQKWYGSFTFQIQVAEIQRLELCGSYGLGREMCHRSYGLDAYMTACKGPCCTSRNTCGASPMVQWQKYDSLARSTWSRTDGLAITSSARSTWSRTDGLARSTWRRIDGLARSTWLFLSQLPFVQFQIRIHYAFCHSRGNLVSGFLGLRAGLIELMVEGRIRVAEKIYIRVAYDALDLHYFKAILLLCQRDQPLVIWMVSHFNCSSRL